MEVQINDKSYPVRFSSQLTAKEYIKYMSSLSEGSKSYEQLISYLSVTTKASIPDIESSATIDIDDNSIRRLSSYIGVVPQINEFTELDSFYYKRKGRTIYKKSLNWRTLGTRKMLEERGIENSLEQSVYLLAVYVSGDCDSENIELIYNELLDYEASKVFGFVVFFFTKLTSGPKLDRNGWLTRKIKAFISILGLSKK